MDRWEPCSREDKEHHGRSTRDGNRAFAQAEDESTPGTLSGAVWRRITVFESRAPVSADCLALAGEGSGRSERAGAETSGGTGRRCRSATAGTTPLLARGWVRRIRAGPGARSASAARRDSAETSVWGAHDRSDRARDRVRVSGKILSVLEPDCAARDRNTLEPVSLR